MQMFNRSGFNKIALVVAYLFSAFLTVKDLASCGVFGEGMYLAE